MLVAFIGDLFGQVFSLFVIAFFIVGLGWCLLSLLGILHPDLAEKIDDTFIQPLMKLFKTSEDEKEEA